MKEEIRKNKFKSVHWSIDYVAYWPNEELELYKNKKGETCTRLKKIK